jgi:hypothetical protein
MKNTGTELEVALAGLADDLTAFLLTYPTKLQILNL